MRIKSLVSIILCCLFSVSFATTQHQHPAIDQNGKVNAGVTSPGYCEIELINLTNNYVTVTGVFDDNFSLIPFTMLPYDAPHKISLYYYGYCHNGMYLDLRVNGGLIYSKYTVVNTTLRVVSYANKLKAEVTVK